MRGCDTPPAAWDASARDMTGVRPRPWRLRAVEAFEPRDFVGRQLAPLAGGEAVEGEAGVLASVQPAYRVADRFAHPLHLVLSPLVDDQLDARWPQEARACRRRPRVLELHALGQPRQRLVRDDALHFRLVHLLDLVTRMHQPVRQRPVVREEESARRIRVEPPDGNDAALVTD